ncbi:MAG TPA: winged helix-turn-helix domain-containing protein, partial [Jiangellales bacterium]|nr:winged helix-turn-helix domain-containing protein [Jiangellales bacterium]
MTFAVLGPLEVLDSDGHPVDVPGRQERVLLALLLTAPGRVFAVSEIAAGLWAGEPPSRADKTVQSYVSRLRRALPGGDTLVLTRRPGYVLAVDPAWVDAERFRASVSAGRRELSGGQAASAADHLRAALALW